MIKQILPALLYDKLELLECEVNYWLLLNSAPMRGNNQVYDGQKAPLVDLVTMGYAVKDGFYIADKKYNWIIYFFMDTQSNMIEMYKGGTQ